MPANHTAASGLVNVANLPVIPPPPSARYHRDGRLVLASVPNTIKIYEGPSVMGGGPVMVALSCVKSDSDNTKTGPMVQLYVFPRDVPPAESVETGADACVCGDCPFRPSERASLAEGYKPCYVQKGWLRSAWNAARRADVTPADEAVAWVRAVSKRLRVGAWGDPYAAPEWLWQLLFACLRSAGMRWTGYTHQWRRPGAAYLRAYLMASVETTRDKARANKAGWRTFRVTLADGAPTAREILCPAASRGVQCNDCGLCDGSRGASDRRANVYIPTHGNG